MRVLVRAPDHLGDGVMALPAVEAAVALGEAVIAGPRWCGELYRDLPARVVSADEVPRIAADLAVLLKPSFSAAWAARKAGRRVGLATDHRGLLLSVAVPPRGPHRIDDLNAVARAAGGEPAPLPCYRIRAADAADLPALPADAVLLLPGTAKPQTVRWPGYAALGRRLGARAVFAGGAADMAVLQEIADGARVLGPLSIPALAALSARVGAVVGNDSGLPHLAAAARRAAGLDVGALHVIYGSTDPTRTGPPGSTAHAGTRPPCWPCYASRCAIGTPCLDLGVERLLAALG